MTQPLSWVKTYEILVLGKWLDPDVMAYQNSTSQNSQSGLFTLKKLESLGSKYVYVYIYISCKYIIHPVSGYVTE